MSSGRNRGSIRRSKNSFLGDTWANCKRWLLKFFKTPPLLVMNLVQPVIFLFLFSEVFGQVVSGPISGALGESVSYITYILPAIVMQVSMGTSQGAGMSLVRDMEDWIFEKVMVYPMGKTAIFLGKTFSELFRIVIQAGIILGLGVLLGAEIATGFLGALGVIGVGILFALFYISFTTIIAMGTQDQEIMTSIMMPIMFPLLFLSSAFLPLGKLPGWIQTFAKFNPVTYGIDAARSILMGKNVMTVIDVTSFSGMWNAIIPAVGMLLVFILVLGGLAVYMIRRGTSPDVK